MRDKNRINPILDMLKIVWNEYPDVRLGQLLHIAIIRGGIKNKNFDLFHIEDDQILKGLNFMNRMDNEQHEINHNAKRNQRR